MPSQPGVYIFAEKDQKPLYIGKSISLVSRIRQHLENSRFDSQKASRYVPQTKTLIYQVVDSDTAAIILESNLIKAYQPFYNSAVKDDKSVCYLLFTNQPNVRLSLIRKGDIRDYEIDNPQTQLYGPYSNSLNASLILKQVRRIFGYCQNPIGSKASGCFYYHLNQCPGVCAGKMSLSEYYKHLGKIKSFLSGEFVSISKLLTSQIKQAAKKEDYDTAANLKKELEAFKQTIESHKYSNLLVLPTPGSQVIEDSIRSLNHPLLKSLPHRIECYDMAHLQNNDTVGAMTVLINGKPSPQNYRLFLVETPEKGDPQTMKHIVERRLRHKEWEVPGLIVLDGGVPQLSIVSNIIPSQIPMVALSKKRETIHFFDENHKIVNCNLKYEDSFLKLLQTIRDEAHRFGTTFHKKRRQKHYT